jgi:hypothetical protein
MSPQEFCYWLQGYAEIHGGPITAEQWLVIKDHLQEVFHKTTPNRQSNPISPGIPKPFPYEPNPLDKQRITESWPNWPQPLVTC